MYGEEELPVSTLGGSTPLPCWRFSPANQYIDSSRSLMDRLGVGKGPLEHPCVLAGMDVGSVTGERGETWG